MLLNTLDDKISKSEEMLPVGFKYLLNLFHGQNVKDQPNDAEEAKALNKWISPYSEISRT